MSTTRGWRTVKSGKGLVIALAALWFVSAAAFAALADDAKTGELEVVVSGMETDKGKLVVALMNSQATFEDDTAAFREQRVAVSGGKATAVFTDVPFGEYAIKTFHDENSNDKLDTNFVGYPKEAFGFSNDAMGRFGPPSFAEAKFELASPKLRIEIHSN